jgi:Na+/pantothenate symporter
MKHRVRWALIVSGIWALLPLGYYLPEPAARALDSAIMVLCFPAWVLSYLLLGGVHSGMFSAFPVVCSLLTGMTVFAVFLLVTKDPARERKVPDSRPPPSV